MFIYIMAGGLLLGMLVILWILPSITRGINVVSMMLKSFGEGRLKAIRRIKVTSKDEFGDVARVFKDLSEDIIEKRRIEETYLQARRDQSWLNSNMARVTESLEGSIPWRKSVSGLSANLRRFWVLIMERSIFVKKTNIRISWR